MSIIEFQRTSKHFGDLKVLDQVDLSINEGEVVVLIASIISALAMMRRRSASSSRRRKISYGSCRQSDRRGVR
ncbi:hypothetical protein [Paracoccus mutanolyticus]|uniref:hypothetical protein n=1 Tax=Paracoccus mutanolyticus TaxID=1499308 RepID=UPI001CB9A0B4|nr:hypothetical protein [Paracoccus mutanolyticus]